MLTDMTVMVGGCSLAGGEEREPLTPRPRGESLIWREPLGEETNKNKRGRRRRRPSRRSLGTEVSSAGGGSRSWAGSEPTSGKRGVAEWWIDILLAEVIEPPCTWSAGNRSPAANGQETTARGRVALGPVCTAPAATSDTVLSTLPDDPRYWPTTEMEGC
ncbi:hypothetical protein AAFF_G00413460 [Aldrovandia affinis]|uniref:Uncharacterized protein n=1 Tax=Aldrovandia affinis TaxID=143900 RepID=A0AAD7SBK4_9TELE|nr:hypothetical protein AAFF_G00413460 [Aldrovandia affinis]